MKVSNWNDLYVSAFLCCFHYFDGVYVAACIVCNVIHVWKLNENICLNAVEKNYKCDCTHKNIQIVREHIKQIGFVYVYFNLLRESSSSSTFLMRLTYWFVALNMQTPMSWNETNTRFSFCIYLILCFFHRNY